MTLTSLVEAQQSEDFDFHNLEELGELQGRHQVSRRRDRYRHKLSEIDTIVKQAVPDKANLINYPTRSGL